MAVHIRVHRSVMRRRKKITVNNNRCLVFCGTVRYKVIATVQQLNLRQLFSSRKFRDFEHYRHGHVISMFNESRLKTATLLRGALERVERQLGRVRRNRGTRLERSRLAVENLQVAIGTAALWNIARRAPAGIEVLEV